MGRCERDPNLYGTNNALVKASVIRWAFCVKKQETSLKTDLPKLIIKDMINIK